MSVISVFYLLELNLSGSFEHYLLLLLLLHHRDSVYGLNLWNIWEIQVPNISFNAFCWFTAHPRNISMHHRSITIIERTALSEHYIIFITWIHTWRIKNFLTKQLLIRCRHFGLRLAFLMYDNKKKHGDIKKFIMGDYAQCHSHCTDTAKRNVAILAIVKMSTHIQHLSKSVDPFYFFLVMSRMDAQLTPPVFMLCISWQVCSHASQQEENEKRQQEKENNTLKLHDILAVSLLFFIETQKEHIEEKWWNVSIVPLRCFSYFVTLFWVFTFQCSGPVAIWNESSGGR